MTFLVYSSEATIKKKVVHKRQLIVHIGCKIPSVEFELIELDIKN